MLSQKIILLYMPLYLKSFCLSCALPTIASIWLFSKTFHKLQVSFRNYFSILHMIYYAYLLHTISTLYYNIWFLIIDFPMGKISIVCVFLIFSLSP